MTTETANPGRGNEQRETTMSAIPSPPRETEGLDELGCAARELLLPARVGYDTGRRIWNGAIDRRPGRHRALRRGVADVVAAVRFARERICSWPSAQVATGSAGMRSAMADS